LPVYHYLVVITIDNIVIVGKYPIKDIRVAQVWKTYR